MDEPKVASKPCCVCAAPNGKHCMKCKSRHYCGKECQLVDWKRGHKAQCKQLTASLDALMPEKKPKEAPAIAEGVLQADGAKARLSAVRAAKPTEAGALSDDASSWRGTCAICLDMLPVEGDKQTFFSCCCKCICTVCHDKCRQHDKRCPLCRSPPYESDAEWVRRVQKHVDKGNTEAQVMLGNEYRTDGPGLQQSFQRAVQLYERAAAQGHAEAQNNLGTCYSRVDGVELDYKIAAQWFRRAAEEGHPSAQYNFGMMFAAFEGQGVAQSDDEAVLWFRLAAAQGHADALYNLGVCHKTARVCRRTSARHCASTSAPRPRGTPARRRRSNGSWRGSRRTQAGRRDRSGAFSTARPLERPATIFLGERPPLIAVKVGASVGDRGAAPLSRASRRGRLRTPRSKLAQVDHRWIVR